MKVANGVAICHNGACKNFGVEFVAPNLELQPVPGASAPEAAPAVAEAPAAEASEEDN